MYSLHKNEYRIFKPVETIIRMVERRKIEEMNQFGLHYTDTWKCHKETPCVAVLNKNAILCSFTKSEKRRAKQIPPGGLVSMGWRRGGEE
jgi:hypothetical protein